MQCVLCLLAFAALVAVASAYVIGDFGLYGAPLGSTYLGGGTVLGSYSGVPAYNNIGLLGRSALGYSGLGYNSYVSPYTTSYSSPIVSYGLPTYGYFKK